jgi:DNA-binding GntR family transcriptional regulator
MARSTASSRSTASRRAASPPTRTSLVFDSLRADILGGRLAPAQRLPFAVLVSQFDCSVGVIREALQRLAEQGLVESEAQQGFRVVGVSVADLLELTEARCEIEVLALRLAIADGDVAWEAEAVAAHHVLERTPMYDPDGSGRFTEEWASAHALFHQALLGGCRNRRILTIATSLRDSAELYRRWSVPLGHDQQRDISGEHRAMLDAAVGRKAEAACDALRQHIQRTTDKLLPAVSQADR